MIEIREEKKFDGYQRVLRINDSIGLEKKYEAVNEFGNSFFRDNYYNAFAITGKILARNEEIKKKDSGKCDTGQEKLYNIITFCGGRGSGKTSVMDSVVKALHENLDEYKGFVNKYEKRGEQDSEQKESDAVKRMGKCQFACVEMIDASMLEEKEDILDAILSKMYQQIDKKVKRDGKCYLLESYRDNSFMKEDISRKIEDICQSRRRLQKRMDGQYDIGESSIEILGDLAGSMDIRVKLKELIDLYLKTLYSDCKEDSCLVISIDDLDMHRNAHRMLEQLHRYLMIPRVVIYLTVSEREIQSVCKKYFGGIYDRSENLTMSYLEKVLPYSRRIYLPATFSGDFFNVSTEEDSNLYGYPVKRFLLREIGQKAWVYYDGCGSETHFYEIENLRTLINTYYLLESMEGYGAEELLTRRTKILKDHRNTLDLNFEKLRNDVIGRMAEEKINDSEQKRIFDRYYKEDFSSNGEYLLREIAKITKIKDKKTKDKRIPEYNYGELMRALFTLEKERQEYKPLIQCVLALATIELTQNYLYAFVANDDNSRKKWKQYISGSVIGDWGNQIVPGIIHDEETVQIAYVKEYAISISVLLDIPALKLESSNQVLPPQRKLDICEWLIDEGELVESVALLLSFFTGKEDATLEIKEEQSGKLQLYLAGKDCTFDVLGFVINGMKGKAFTEKLEKLLLNAFKKYTGCGDDDKAWNTARDNFKKKMKKCPFMEEYEKWYEKYNGAVLPVYSMDIMFQILKRVKKRIERAFPQEIKDVLESMQKFYMFLGDCLTEEDMFYGERTETDKTVVEIRKYTDFYLAFLENPFVKRFVKGQDLERMSEEELLRRAEKELEKNQNEEENPNIMITARPGPTKEVPIDTLPQLFKNAFNEVVKETVDKVSKRTKKATEEKQQKEESSNG